MFTGIVQKVARVTHIEAGSDFTRVRVATGFADLEMGESIAVNGVCLTVVEFDTAGEAMFFISPETLARSNLGRLASGSAVNLERAVTLSTRLSGHLVQGHVDRLAELAAVERDDESYRVVFRVPAQVARYCVEKGSICLNGVSLTINSLSDGPAEGDDALLGITLIPHTWTHTNLSQLAVGDPVNVEVDVMAKYVERLCLPYLKR